jgi:hypothetical protein
MTWTYLLTAGVVIFSLFAAGAWMTSTGKRTFELLPWRPSVLVSEDQLVEHQTKWNARAALFAAIAAVFQAALFFYQYYL